MNRLDNLKETADEMLGGLHASQELKQQILLDAGRAAEGKPAGRNTPWQSLPKQKHPTARILRSAAALACVAVLMLGILAGIPGLLGRSITPQSPIEIQTGGVSDKSGLTAGRDIGLGDISVSGGSRSGGSGLWAQAEGANFPLLRVGGRYYRLMNSPGAADTSLLDEGIGTVDSFTGEPALAEGGCVSNIVSEGETVYSLRGMGNAAAAARVDGTMRIFQRVSYGNSGLTAGESLPDTLGNSPIRSLEMTGVGTVSDPQTAQMLYSILVSRARPERSSAGESSQSLLIGFDNGLTLQMYVRDASLMACGTWSCPEFFEAFVSAASR